MIYSTTKFRRGSRIFSMFSATNTFIKLFTIYANKKGISALKIFLFDLKLRIKISPNSKRVFDNNNNRSNTEYGLTQKFRIVITIKLMITFDVRSTDFIKKYTPK